MRLTLPEKEDIMHLWIRFLFLLCLTTALTTITTPPRHVCLIHNYASIAGPQFSALLDEFHQNAFPPSTQKRVAILTVNDDDSDENAKSLSILQKDLSLFLLDDQCVTVPLHKGPRSFRQALDRFQNVPPTMLWLHGDLKTTNAHWLRHWLRACNADGVIEELCGGWSTPTIFVGEGSGAVCAGASVRTHPTASQPPPPEPQFRGLELLGPNLSVLTIGSNDDEPQQQLLDDARQRLGHEALPLRESQAFLWSQQEGNDVAQSFFADKMGCISKLSFPKPLDSIIQPDTGEGRKCVGEPSIDPSRAMQSSSDSEWFD